MCIIGLKVVSGQHLSSLRIKPRADKENKSTPNIKLLCRPKFELVWDGYLIFVISTGFGYLERSKSKNHYWFWVFEKKTRIKELPGPSRCTEKKSESNISDKYPEAANALILIIPGIFRA
jgi:hypothetical protein